MKNNNMQSYFLAGISFIAIALVTTFVITQSITANDENSSVKVHIPPLHPTDVPVIPDTVVPEFGYYYTPKASEAIVEIGPCSPCVGMQICNTENDECLYVHHGRHNDPLEPVKKVQEHFAAPQNGEKLELDVTLFSNFGTDYHGMDQSALFAEGSHKKRVENLAKQLELNANVKSTTIYYTETPTLEDYMQGNKDRTVLFKNKKAYGMNITQQEGEEDRGARGNFRMSTYLDIMLRKKFADRVYYSHEDSIWKRRDNPLFRIKKPNAVKINSLPSARENLMHRYFDIAPAATTTDTAENLGQNL